jgi:hypothetical protein
MRSMRDLVQGRDRSVRGIVSKGQFVQGAQHPRTFGQGHIGRGHINPAIDRYTVLPIFQQNCRKFKLTFFRLFGRVQAPIK